MTAPIIPMNHTDKDAQRVHEVLAVSGLNHKDFASDYLIRIYEDMTQRSQHKLVGLTTLIKIIDNDDIVARWISRAEKNRMKTYFDGYTRCKLRGRIEVVLRLR